LHGVSGGRRVPRRAIVLAAGGWRGLRAATAFRFFWEDFLIPLAHSMVPGIRAAVDEFAPDVVLADQQALAGALVARERKLPWATSATTTAELTGQYETMPKLGIWAQEQLTELQADYRSQRSGGSAVLRPTGAGLLQRRVAQPAVPAGAHITFVGRRSVVAALPLAFDWECWIRTAGTCWCRWGRSTKDSGDRFFAVAAEAFAALAGSVQGIFVMPPGTVVDLPPNVLAAPAGSATGTGWRSCTPWSFTVDTTRCARHSHTACAGGRRRSATTNPPTRPRSPTRTPECG